MLHSMTGFGKAEQIISGKQVTIEIRSLNSQKGFDLTLRIPNCFKDLEYSLRTFLSEKLIRGKVDVIVNSKAVSVDSTGIQKDLVRVYYQELAALATELNANKDQLFTEILKFPDVVAGEKEIPLLDSEAAELQNLMEQAIQEVIVFRKKEGLTTETEMSMRAKEIAVLLNQIKPLDLQRVSAIKERVKNNLDLIVPKEKIDNNRFEQELIYYIEKLDISEEVLRLATHLEHFEQTIHSPEVAVGKKLTFITQEMGREINTIGSKASDAGIQKLVVCMKDELEKIKEQCNNIL